MKFKIYKKQSLFSDGSFPGQWYEFHYGGKTPINSKSLWGLFTWWVKYRLFIK